MIDEIAHKSCKDPVVGAVPVQVGNGHGALAVPAKFWFLSKYVFQVITPPGLHDIVHLQYKPEAPVPHRELSSLQLYKDVAQSRAPLKYAKMLVRSAKLLRALFAFHQNNSLGSVGIVLRAYLWTKNVSSIRLA